MECECKICEARGEIVESTDLVCLPCYSKLQANFDKMKEVVIDVIELLGEIREDVALFYEQVHEEKEGEKVYKIAERLTKLQSILTGDIRNTTDERRITPDDIVHTNRAGGPMR